MTYFTTLSGMFVLAVALQYYLHSYTIGLFCAFLSFSKLHLIKKSQETQNPFLFSSILIFLSSFHCFPMTLTYDISSISFMFTAFGFDPWLWFPSHLLLTWLYMAWPFVFSGLLMFVFWYGLVCTCQSLSLNILTNLTTGSFQQPQSTHDAL